MKPNKPLLRKWVAALRSGKYHQQRYTLCRKRDKQTFHCCLGVACRVAIKNNIDIQTVQGDDSVLFSYQGCSSASVLPESVRYKFGIHPLDQDEFIRMNDKNQTSFKEIADFIETKYNLK